MSESWCHLRATDLRYESVRIADYTPSASISESACTQTVDIWSHGTSRDPVSTFPLFHPQRLGRVDGGGAPGGNPGGDQCNQDEHGRHKRKRHRVVRFDAVEKTRG